MRLDVKWGKQVFKDVEVDLEQPPLVFKSQLFALSGVLPERQKVMVKAKLLKDESWDSVGQLKEGQTILLMGSAEPVKVSEPSNPVKFIEDMPEEEQDYYDLQKYGAGLKNLGNTCYMNATLQLLYSVPELRQSLVNYGSNVGAGVSNPSGQLTASAGRLFSEMSRSGMPVVPMGFLLSLRSRYPQFEEMAQPGVYKQQDAEECFSQIAHSLTESIKADPSDGSSESQMHELFGIDFVTKLECKETEETITLKSTETKLKCNIPNNPPIHHIHQGITEGLKADRSQRSEIAGANVLFEGQSEIEKLPPYVMLHMVRFSYRRDTRHRAKILRKIAFPAIMDLYEFCTAEYRQVLDGPRKRFQDLRNEEVEKRLTTKEPAPSADGQSEKIEEGSAAQSEVEKKDSEQNLTVQAAESEEQPTVKTESLETDVVMQESSERPPHSRKELTGRYRLMGLLTHKGRTADSGHYVAWVKQEDSNWIEFDDENLIPRDEEHIMQLSGGGDWHMAYLLLFKAETVEMPSA